MGTGFVRLRSRIPLLFVSTYYIYALASGVVAHLRSGVWGRGGFFNSEIKTAASPLSCRTRAQRVYRRGPKGPLGTPEEPVARLV